MSQRKAHVVDDRERTEDIQIDENVDFEGMYLSDNVLRGLNATGFERPSPIQLAAIPLGRCGLDMVVQAKSGTGKTCVFAVVALEMVSVSASTTQVLVLTPTREIAVQVTQVICAIGSKMPGLRACTFIGGLHVSLDKAKLLCCHIAVGTPGRIMQLIEMGLLKLDNIRLFVLDEADQLLSGNFANDIACIGSGLPLNKQVITLSATYTEDVAKVAEGLMRSPNHVRLDKDSPALLGVDQYVKLLPFHHQPHKRQQLKLVTLVGILSKITFNQCLVFSNSQLRAESVCNKLRAAGWPVSFLTGGQAQQDRLVALDALCSYKCRILVSTDLSARGLDSEHVNLVVNLDMPKDHATYLHRVGRAGRFGSRGCAITLATEGEDWLSMRAVSTLANVQICVMKGDLIDIMKEECEEKEYIEFLNEEEFTQYVIISNSQKNCDKSEKATSCKQKSDSGTKSKKITESKLVDNAVVSINGASNGYIIDDYARDKTSSKKSQSKDDSFRKYREAMQKKAEQLKREDDAREKVKASNLLSVQNIVNSINVEFPTPNVTFNNILEEVTRNYSNISVSDNPVLHIPNLPNALELSELEQKCLRDHLKDREDEVQEEIHEISESWRDQKFTIEDVLQDRVEGKEVDFPLKSTGKGKDKLEYLLQKCEGLGTPFFSSSLEEIGIPHSVSQTVLQKEHVKTSKRYQPITDVGDPSRRQKRDRKKRAVSHKRSRQEANRHPQLSSSESEVQQYYANTSDDDASVDCKYCQNKQRTEKRRYNFYRSASHSSHRYSEYDSYSGGPYYENYVRSSLATYQRHLDHIEKFSAMMDYVHTMGKVSAWIAQDYFSGLENS